jgi:hypothetical protein
VTAGGVRARPAREEGASLDLETRGVSVQAPASDDRGGLVARHAGAAHAGVVCTDESQACNVIHALPTAGSGRWTLAFDGEVMALSQGALRQTLIGTRLIITPSYANSLTTLDCTSGRSESSCVNNADRPDWKTFTKAAANQIHSRNVPPTEPNTSSGPTADSRSSARPMQR